MSAFELDNIGDNGREPNLSGTISSIPITKQTAGRVDVAMLSSRFESLERMSKCGGVASFLARDLLAKEGDALVVLDVLEDSTAESRQVELFRLEAEASAGLSHRNILRSSPGEEIDGVHFSISEHRSGAETLRDFLDRQGWLDLSLAVGIIHQLADALEYAHAMGILHLRIHTGNILIDPDGTALLVDFGLEARRDLAWAHAERSSHCPIHYISPEQASGKSLDPRSDLYSLGIVLYQMLTDRLPVDSMDPDAVRHKHLTQPPLSAHLYRSDIPYPVSDVITRMLEKDPAKRFADVASFRAALDISLNESIGRSDVLTRIEENQKIENIENPHQNEKLEENDTVDAYAFDQSVTLAIAEMRETLKRPSDTSTFVPAAGTELKSALEEGAPSASAPAAPRLSPNLTNTPPAELRRRSGSMQWRPMMLVLALSIAAIVGLIDLARADRTRDSERVSGGPPVKKDAEARSDRASSPSAAANEEKSPGNTGHSIADTQLPKNNSAKAGSSAAGPATNSPLRKTQRRITRTTTSQRARLAKRKGRSATRYGVHYRATNKRYYRSGER